MHAVDLYRMVAREIGPYLGARMAPFAEWIGTKDARYWLHQTSDANSTIGIRTVVHHLENCTAHHAVADTVETLEIVDLFLGLEKPVAGQHLTEPISLYPAARHLTDVWIHLMVQNGSVAQSN